MDLGWVRGLITLTLLIAFIALTLWVWSRQNKQHFDAAARLPLEDDIAPTRVPVKRQELSTK